MSGVEVKKVDWWELDMDPAEGKARAMVMTLESQLVGATVTALLLDKGEGSAFFVTDRGIVEARCEGDCCSETWFADIVGVSNLFAEVDKVEDIPLPDFVNVEDGRGRQSQDQAYAVRISTALGSCEFVYRNSSNGYYGGNISVLKHEALPDGLREVVEDFGA